MTAPIPNLSSLPLKSHHDIVEDAPNGVYCLDCIEDLSTCSSSIIIVRDVISFCKEDTQELENFMSNENNVPQTLNQWGRYLLRRQATNRRPSDGGLRAAGVCVTVVRFGGADARTPRASRARELPRARAGDHRLLPLGELESGSGAGLSPQRLERRSLSGML